MLFKSLLYAAITAAVVYTSFYIFNHISAWLGIFTFIGLVIYGIYKLTRRF